MFLMKFRQRPGASLRTRLVCRRASSRRGTAIWLVLAATLILPEVHAASESKVLTIEQLRTALRENQFVPRAFIKGDEIRLYFTNAQQSLMFKADWDRARNRVHGFSSHLTELKFDASPPAMPTSQQKWREPKVLAYAEWERFAHLAVGSLAPSEAGHGVYLQYALGDAVVFRNSAGEIKVERFASLPAGIVIDRRLSRAEATPAIASVVETNLHNSYPQESAFLLAPPAAAQRTRLALLDLTERRVVTLMAPLIKDPDGTPQVGARLSGLVSFILVDNAWAILKNPVSSTARLLNFCVQWPASLFGPRLRKKASEIPPLIAAPGMDLLAWEQWLDAHTGTARERGSLRLLMNGERFYPVFEDRLSQASHSIDINVCIFDRDDVAVQIADQLKQRSTTIPVQVIVDHNSSRSSGKAPPTTPMPEGFVSPKSITAYLKANSAVQVRPFLNPFMTSDHSKVYLIDGRYGYIGGMNIGREYRYEWHDMMVEIEGPVVASFQHEFNENWAHAGPFGDCAFAEQVVCGKRPQAAETNRSDFVDLRRIYTKTGSRQIWHAELESIARAQSYVFLENPYLFDNAIIVALVKARLRGVDVRVILPSGNDLTGGEGSNLVTANYLFSHGVRVYLYPGMTHVKAMMVDGWACFGSANFNTLSLRLNQETDLATSDPGFSGRFKQELFELDFEKSSQVKEPVSVTWSDHLADSMLNLF